VPGLRMTGGTPGMESDRGPGPSLEQRLLDIAVYAPVGLVVAVGESFPRLIADGRRRLGPGVASAQVVGRFAASAGYGLLCRRLDGLRRSGATQPQPVATQPQPVATQPQPVATPRDEVPEGRGGEGATGGDRDVAPSRRGRDAAVRDAPVRDGAARPARSGVRRSVEAPGGPDPGSGPTPAVEALAIPGFASLSASQVVQRLDGLTESELRDLRAFEAGTRHRRTILNRVDQLLGT